MLLPTSPSRPTPISCTVHILLLLLFYCLYDFVNYDFVNLFKFSSNEYVCTPKLELPKINLCDTVVLITTSILIIYLLFIILLYHSKAIRYVRFSNNISTLNKKSLVQIKISALLFANLLLCPIFMSISFEFIFSLLIQFEIDTFHVNVSLQFCYKLLTLFYKTLYVFMLKFSFKIIQYITMLFKKSLYSWENFLLWVILIIIILSNDVEKNPGDFSNGGFSFCNWNLNSLAKDDFYRVQLLEAHNAIFNYDIISLCETSLNNTVELPNPMMDGYTFISCNNSLNQRHGGVGLLYKNSLPIKLRNDLAFNESIVVELKFGNKKIFFTVLYRNPAYKLGSVEFNSFLLIFENMYTSIKKENPYAVFIAGDFNGHAQLWWPLSDTTPEGSSIEEMASLQGLSQLIKDPTNFEPNKNPSCIDLIFTDQPNLVLEWYSFVT